MSSDDKEVVMNSNGAYRSVIMHVLKIIVVVASCLCMVLCSTACGRANPRPRTVPRPRLLAFLSERCSRII